MKTQFKLIASSLLVIIVGVMLITGCETKPREGDGNQPDDSTVVSDEHQYDSALKRLITVEQAQEMFQAYQPRFEALRQLGGKEDASYGWHPIEFYKQYIDFLEDEAAKHKIKISGLRLYFAAYPEEGYGKSSGYQTYILVPTYFDETTKSHKAFDLFHIDPATNTPLDMHEILTQGASYNKKSSSIDGNEPQFKKASIVSSKSSSANLSLMCQPYCD